MRRLVLPLLFSLAVCLGLWLGAPHVPAMIWSSGTGGTSNNLSNVTNDAQLKRADGDLNSFATKVTTDPTDIMIIEDSTAGFAKKKVLMSTFGSPALADDSVTFAKLQNISQASLVGRVSSGPGDPEELSVPVTRTLLAIENVDNTSDATKLSAPGVVSNKLVLPRVVTPTVTSNAITPDLDVGDIFVLDAISADLTINAPVGTAGKPFNEQRIEFRFTSSAPRALIWDPVYSEENGIPRPSSTTGNGSTVDRIKYVLNSTTAKYGLVASTIGVVRGTTTLASSTTYTCNIQLASKCKMQMTGVAGTVTIANPTGTPQDGWKLQLNLMCTNLQTIAWDTKFIASAAIALVTSCPADVTKWVMFGVEYSSDLDKFQLIATTN